MLARLDVATCFCFINIYRDLELLGLSKLGSVSRGPEHHGGLKRPIPQHSSRNSFLTLCFSLPLISPLLFIMSLIQQVDLENKFTLESAD